VSLWWKYLSEVSGEGQEGRWFDKNIKWKVRSGTKIKFWEDTCLGDTLSNVIFPRLYANSNNREQTLIELGSWISNIWV